MAKIVKLKDRHSNPIFPLTRSTAVEMNDGMSVEEKFKNIEKSQKLSFYTTGTCSVNVYTKDESLNGDYSKQTPIRTVEYSANTNVSLNIGDTEHFEIVNPNDCINIIYSWPGVCEKFYDWFMNVNMFCNMIFNFNKMDHSAWEHSTTDGTKYKFGVVEAQYRNCIFWWDVAFSDPNVHCYILHKTQECPLFYSTIPENTYKTLCEPYNITNNPNFTNEVFLNSFALANGKTALAYSHTRSVPFGCWQDASVVTNIIKINGDCRTFLAWSGAEDTATFDCETVTNFGYRLSGNNMYWNGFYECRNLKNLMLKNLKVSVNLSWSPISQYSLDYIINNAANTSAITIALSPYTWYNLTDSIKTTAESKNINLILDKSHYSDMQDMKIWDDVEGIKNSYLSADNLDLTSYVSKTELNAAGYISSFTETDPTVPSYVKGITETDITNWNNKQNTLSFDTAPITDSTNPVTSGGIKTALDGKQDKMLIVTATVTGGNGSTYYDATLDKTHSEIVAAMQANKNVYIYIPSMFGGSYVQLTQITSGDTNAFFVVMGSDLWYCHTSHWDDDNSCTIHKINYLKDSDLDFLINEIWYDTTNKIVKSRNCAGNVSNILTFETTLTANSTNPVTSEGIKTYLDNYYTKSEIDNASYIQWSEKNEHEQNTNALSANVISLSSSTDRYIYSNGGIRFDDAGLKLVPNGNNELMISDVNDTTQYYFRGDKQGDVAITSDITKAINSYVISASYLQSFTESDPTVPAHVKSITQQNITDWNNKLSSETQLSKGTTTGSGNAVTDISVSNHQITLTKGLTFLTSHQNIKTINNQTITGTGNVTINELPTVSSSDNGKVLQVVNGQWQLVTPLNLYSGTGTPDNSQGNNGDLYMQI